MKNEHQDHKSQNQNNEQGQATEKTTDKQSEEKSTETQIDNTTAMGILCYLGILVIVPIALSKESDFVMYHANQGLVLLIAAIILSGIGMIPFLGWLIGFFGWIAIIILAIMGIINVTNEKKKPLPLIGGIQLLK